MSRLNSKVLGSLVGAAAGDALGAATELRTIEQIKTDFNGWVTTFIAPPQDTFGRCNEAGMVTDDFTQGKYILEAALDHSGEISDEVLRKAFSRWMDYPFYTNFTGPTTRAAMQRIFKDTRQSLQGNVEAGEPTQDVVLVNNGNASATNGAAMKAWAASMLSLRTPEQLIAMTHQIAHFTHNNVISVSGSCAISVAVNAALSDGVTLKDVMEAATKGADQGYFYAKQHGAMMMAGPSVARRIELAIQIGKKHASWESAVSELADIIGTGLHASEAVPAVFGILACCGNDPEKAILAAVNIGNDTDTVATMVGSIVGALHGIEALPGSYLPVLNKANKFELEDLATRILQLHDLDNSTNNFIPKTMLQ
ncbi:MAG: ADP-ribosylglycohydrolase family protein [Gammaproteobacteria bacterium]|nr:ADP-ribosylglycohydrolase family protein [Gammaproteobacteria bacterium]MDH5302963.1 ADP-ribosylglycohydrolase family protein [Gammaproteobacteria bacterium]